MRTSASARDKKKVDVWKKSLPSPNVWKRMEPIRVHASARYCSDLEFECRHRNGLELLILTEPRKCSEFQPFTVQLRFPGIRAMCSVVVEPCLEGTLMFEPRTI
ncbi:uncharacterized protein LOC143153459 isoform X1 [Ptiloglossa arizonensis]|uniref:uncharacterized protein LOC143153459 isoform X1 n=1 Tax=Ptiloglossa arizonensis TaxID=3350558 RepID=UPI003FA18CF4